MQKVSDGGRFLSSRARVAVSLKESRVAFEPPLLTALSQSKATPPVPQETTHAVRLACRNPVSPLGESKISLILVLQAMLLWHAKSGAEVAPTCHGSLAQLFMATVR